MKQQDHYRQVLRLVSRIGRLTNPQHMKGAGARTPSMSLSQFLVLDALLAANGSLRMSELSRLAGVTSAEASRVVAELEGHRSLERAVDPEDSRARLVAITERGRKLALGVERAASASLRQVWDDFTHEEWHRLVDYLSRLEAGLRRARDADKEARS